MDESKSSKGEKREKKRRKKQEMKKSGQSFANVVRNAIRKRLSKGA